MKEKTCSDTSVIPIELAMRDQIPETINNDYHIIIVNLSQSDHTFRFSKKKRR